ncbi:hypothetical protein [Desulfovibrio gilichinskyi]|uniref:Uncharacterized protein n=1 Tax=Desulfovibrio gilichinskyi TaxID=1519643 RepID=A0A1X7C4K2_9BACT|nr:hypothetical protein [Desulfovibrio gilichinskyi]SME89478.1 hypothetical protein SAMN06295933_0308 [Desulfovibrio gilichinskyi]
MDINSIREKFPQYKDVGDLELAQGFHKKFYSDMPFDDFAKKIGVNSDPIGAREKSTDWGRVGAQMIGGTVGGAIGLASPLPGGTYVGMGLGDAIAGQGYDLAKEYFFGGEGKSFQDRMTESAVDATTGALVPKAFDTAIDVARPVIKGMMGPIKNKLAGAGAKQLAQDYADLGVTPSAGAITGNKGIQATEQAFSQLPASARTMQEAATQTVDDTAKAANQLANQYGSILTPQGAGEQIKGAAENAVGRFKSRSRNLYDAVDEYFPKGEVVPIENTTSYLKEATNAFSDAPELGARFTKGLKDIGSRVAKDAPDGVLDFQTLKRLRTEVGTALGDKFNAVEDVNRAQLKQLYGALTNDLEAAAVAKGGNAHKAYALANRYYKQQMAHNIPTLEKVLQTKTDEAAFKLAISGAQDGGSRLAVLRRNFQPEEWDTVAGTVLGRLGKSSPGQQDIAGQAFSVNSFLTNWNKIAPESKQALFGGSRYSSLEPELDKLLRVVGSQKDVAAMANTSRTGQAIGTMATYMMPLTGFASGGVGGAVSGTAVALSPYAGAKLITNPNFVKWLTDGAKLAKVLPGSYQSQLAKLPIIAKLNPEIETEINDYLNSLK